MLACWCFFGPIIGFCVTGALFEFVKTYNQEKAIKQENQENFEYGMQWVEALRSGKYKNY